MSQLQSINHIVVLMLENRSFDCLLGTLYPTSNSFEGLNGTEQNPDANGAPVLVWNSRGTDETTMRIPNPDPGELWTDINMQLFGNPAPTPSQTATMLGFVQNYLAQQQLNPQQTNDPKSVMHYFASLIYNGFLRPCLLHSDRHRSAPRGFRRGSGKTPSAIPAWHSRRLSAPKSRACRRDSGSCRI